MTVGEGRLGWEKGVVGKLATCWLVVAATERKSRVWARG